MSDANLFDNYSLPNLQNNNYSQFYNTAEENINKENIEETTVTENNITENEVKNLNNKNKNFIEKTEVNNIGIDFFQNNFLYNLKYINALELAKKIDNYYLETLSVQYSNKENKETTISKSRNFISKEKIINNNMIGCDFKTAKLYYYIKINNIYFCTYVDQDYKIYKRFYYVTPKVKSKKGKIKKK